MKTYEKVTAVDTPVKVCLGDRILSLKSRRFLNGGYGNLSRKLCFSIHTKYLLQSNKRIKKYTLQKSLKTNKNIIEHVCRNIPAVSFSIHRKLLASYSFNFRSVPHIKSYICDFLF
jgi:hypothetical protein